MSDTDVAVTSSGGALHCTLWHGCDSDTLRLTAICICVTPVCDVTTLHTHTHTHRFTAIFPGEPGLASCALILLLHLFLDYTSFWDRPKLFTSFLTQSHQVFFGRPVCLIPSTPHVIQRLTQSWYQLSHIAMCVLMVAFSCLGPQGLHRCWRHHESPRNCNRPSLLCSTSTDPQRAALTVSWRPADLASCTGGQQGWLLLLMLAGITAATVCRECHILNF